MGSRQRAAAVILAVLSCVLLAPAPSTAFAHSVFKALAIGTSTQSVTSSTLTWEKFSGVEDHLQNAVRVAEPEKDSKEHVENDHVHPPSYVCRVLIEGMHTAGQTVKDESGTICTVAAQQAEVERHHAFEILINMGGGGRLIWQSWDRYHAGIFGGAVSSGTGKVSFKTADSIARILTGLLCLSYFPVQ